MKNYLKKSICILGVGIALCTSAQAQGRFEVYDCDDFKLHVYYTNDALNDASYIIEGEKSVVTLEQPLFKINIKEYDSYLNQLNKPVEQRITDYHMGGTADHNILMLKGMQEFTKGKIYGEMMKNFSAIFKDAITEMPTGKVSDIDFDTTAVFAGVSFTFSHGAISDFPAASILIGDKAYYTHWSPVKSHANSLQISSPKAIDAEIEEAQEALDSGANIFIGGHGGASSREDLKFKLVYLKTLKEIFENNKDKDAFISNLKQAFPDLPGSEGLYALADVLYK